MIAPWLEEVGCSLYQGDARDVVPRLRGQYDAVITDPVWPNALPELAGSDDPASLLRDTLVDVDCRRLIIILGCNSDPRFLSSTVPARFPFVRMCWLRYSLPSYSGTILNSACVAYVFGDHKATRPRRVLPGEVTSNRSDFSTSRRRESGHPCPRRMEHLRWLVCHFTDPGETILDPFAGSGTTLQAAREHGRRAIGVEIEPRFCEATRERLSQQELFSSSEVAP